MKDLKILNLGPKRSQDPKNITIHSILNGKTSHRTEVDMNIQYRIHTMSMNKMMWLYKDHANLCWLTC